MTAYTFDQIIDFTRTSAATYVANTGFVTQTPASRNLLTYTQEFDNAGWTKSNATITANSTTAPDGTMTADTLIPTTTGGVGHWAFQNVSTVAASYTASVYFKTAGYGFGFIRLRNSSAADLYAWFNLSTGAVGTVQAGLTASIQSVGNGWYRCSATIASPVVGTNPVLFGASNADNVFSFAGDGTSGIYLWGAQLEAVPDANLVLGSELRGSGTTGLSGTATAATYNTSTGEGSVTRVDLSNQSFVSVGSLSSTATYRVAITVSTGTVLLRAGTSTGTTLATLTAGTYIVSVVPTATLVFASSSGTSTFTLTSLREITGTTGMPTTYTRNVGGVYPPRFDYDPVTLAPRGLLIEEQRTNLLVRSEEFDNASWVKATATVTANATTSPDGTVDADKVIVNTGVALGTSTAAGIRQSVSKAASAITYTYTAYLKVGEFNSAFLWMSNAGVTASVRCTFNLAAGTASATTTTGSFTGASATITAVGNGWYRCTLIATSDTDTTVRCDIWPSDTVATTGDGTSGIYLWGAQLEAGAFATSYIPTVASQVTRTADQAAVTGANFSRWYNQSEGTLVVESAATAGSARATTFSAGALANQLWVQAGAVLEAALQVYTSSAFVAQIGILPATATKKIAAAYKTDDFAVSINGAAAATDTSGSVATFDRLNIGSNFNGTVGFINGHIRRIRYYPTRLSNTQLQALTA